MILVACKDKEPKVFKVDPYAMIALKPAPGAWNLKAMRVMSVGTSHLSPLEIVLQTANMKLYNIPIYGDQAVGRGFSLPQRDMEAPMLKMWGTDIIQMDGTLTYDFIGAKKCVLERLFYVIGEDTILLNPITREPNESLASKVIVDTIAYIPDSVLAIAKQRIETAYANNDHEEVYRLFNEAFTFYPITGPEWRQLKENQ